MRPSYKEYLSDHFGLEVSSNGGNVLDVATAVAYADKLSTSEIISSECQPLLRLSEGNTFHGVKGKR